MPLYPYYCATCDHCTDQIFKLEERPESVPCELCDKPSGRIIGGLGAYRIGYEQNGRKAYKVDMGTGSKVYRSATRERYEHEAGNVGSDKYRKMSREEKRTLSESQFTKAAEPHLKKKVDL